MMKNEYRVQFIYPYSDGTVEWSHWDAVSFNKLADAEEEKRRGEMMYPDRKFRIVCRKVTDWEECKEKEAEK